MKYSPEDRALALAGLLQAAWLTDETAWFGRQDETALDASCGSLFKFDATDVGDVFGGRHGVRKGLEILVRLMRNEGSEDDVRLTRYLVQLVNHSQAVLVNDGMLQHLRRGLERAAQQKSHFDTWDRHVMASLADLYVSTVGRLEPRILVRGEPARLQNPDNVNAIRTLLLAGIRAAVLWRQTGGRRWQLIVGRGRLREAAEQLLHA